MLTKFGQLLKGLISSKKLSGPRNALEASALQAVNALRAARKVKKAQQKKSRQTNRKINKRK